MKSLLFFGSETFPTPIFQSIQKHSDLAISGLVTAPHAGKNKHEVLYAAKKSNVPTFAPKNISSEGTDILKATKPDILLVCNYGQILPKHIIQYPRYKTLNIHASLLPELRGACPIEMAILQGLRKTGISIQIMEETLDTGDVIFSKELEIDPRETGGTLTQKLQKLATESVVDVILNWINGTLLPRKQNEAEATYCYRTDISKSAAQIKWTNEAEYIERKIRAFNPRPTAWTFIDDPKQPKRMKILSAEYDSSDLSIEPGKSIRKDNQLLIQTGSGTLLPHEVQLEGKRLLGIEEFMNGYTGELHFI